MQICRQLFYWMVEETPAGWMDEGLASNLDNMIKRMHKNLTKEKLPHYMIYKRNTFDGLPKHKIRQAQEKFHRLQENLVRRLAHSQRRLREIRSMSRNLYTSRTVRMEIQSNHTYV